MVSSLVNLNITIVPSGPVIRLFAKSSLGSEGEIRVSSDSGFRHRLKPGGGSGG